MNAIESFNTLRARGVESTAIERDDVAAKAHTGRVQLAALAVCVIILFGCYTRFAATFPRDSDDAAFVLEAQDILRGNVLLHGWNLPPDTFYASITPWYVIGVLVTRNHAELMYIIPSLIYALLAGFLMYIVWTRGDSAHRIGSVLATFAIVALPAYAKVGPPTASGAEHTATVLFVLATFYMLSAGFRPELSGIPLGLSIIGDPLALFIGVVPLVALGAYHLWYDRSDRRCLVAAAAAALISAAGWTVTTRLGGFTAWGISTEFAALPIIFTKIALLARYSLALFGIEFSAHLSTLLTAPVRIAMLFLVVFAIVHAVSDLLKGSDDLLANLSLLAIGIDAAAYAVSNQPADWTTARYLTPIVVFGGLLAGLCWYRIGISTRYVLAMVCLAALVNTATFVKAMSRPPVEFPNAVISYLSQRGLHEGYGGYWDANLLSVASGGKLRIGAVGLGNHGKLVFFPWYASDEWARMSDARFLIFSGDWAGISEDTATNTWGTPAEAKTIGRYHLLIWNSPLSIANPFSLSQ